MWCSTCSIYVKVAIYHDSLHRNVYVSSDEGRSWQQAEGIPDGMAAMVIAHPFDNRFVSNSSCFHITLLILSLHRPSFSQMRPCTTGQRIGAKHGDCLKSLLHLHP